MDISKQKLLIEYLISSPDTYAICAGIIKPDYFDAEIRNSVNFITRYYNDYNTTPNTDQIKAETGMAFTEQEVGRDKISYCTNEIETFCKQRAVERAVLESVPLIEEQNYGKVEELIRDAVTISLRRELGVNYFDDIEERLRRMLEHDPTHSTGWKDVDDKLFGGISRKELLLVAANSGGGKSITLSNLGVNFIEMGLNVLYFSLELAEDIVAQRFDTMFTGIGRKTWRDHVSEITTQVQVKAEKCGRMDIIQMPAGTTANDIRAYLKEYYLQNKIVPDLLIVDYLDKMGSNAGISAENVFEKDKACSEELRQIAIDYNLFAATASQLNRSAVEATHHNHSHIAGGMSKINEADVFWIIVQTEAQKIEGEICFIFQKTRNSDGVGKTVYLKWDEKHLRIMDADKSAGDLVFKSSKSSTGQFNDTPTGNKLMDLLNNT